MCDRAVRVGDRIAVRIDLRPSEHVVHPLDQALRHDVLELLGLLGTSSQRKPIT